MDEHLLASEMAEALRLIEQTLAAHPESRIGNKKVHFAYETAKGAYALWRENAHYLQTGECVGLLGNGIR